MVLRLRNFKDMFSTVRIDGNLNESDILEEIKSGLGKLDESQYKQWKGAGFNLDHKFTIQILCGIYKITLLYIAARVGHTMVAKVLIEAGAGVDISNDDRWTPLFYAAQYGDMELAKALIEKRADINQRDVDRNTALLIASENNNTGVAKVLIEAGADVNISNDDRWTPLYCAVQKSNMELLKALIEKGADIKDIADVNKQDGGKENTLLTLASKNGDIQLVRDLIRMGAHVDEADSSKNTPLHLSAVNGHTEVVEDLIEAGPSVNVRDEKERTPLYLAVLREKNDVVNVLIKAKADVDMGDEDGRTPLYVAARENNIEVAKALIEARANVNIGNKNGVTPLLSAIEENATEIAEALIEAGADVRKDRDFLVSAICNDNTKVVKALVDAGADVNITHTDGSTFLHQALLFNKNIFIVKELAKRINDINQSDEGGRTPLLLTVGDVNSEVRRYIIRRALLQGVERPREFGGCCYWDKCENEKGKMGESIGKSRISYLDLCNANENDMVTYAVASYLSNVDLKMLVQLISPSRVDKI